MTMVKILAGLAALLGGALLSAEQAAPMAAPKVPTSAEALAAWNDFRVDPLARLARTQPFLDFIRDSGEVHIVLNNELLAWMYQPMDDALKATLYAAFLGGNMAAQLSRQHSDDSDDVAGMESALEAYAAVRKAHPDFTLVLFETLAKARAEQGLAAAVKAVESRAKPAP